MKKYPYLGILLGLAMPSLLFAAPPSSIKFAPKKATTDVFSCEEHAATDEGYTNWFTEKYVCLQADPSNPYKGYIGSCQGSVCQNYGQLGVVELQAALSAADAYLAISADGTTNWTAITGLPATGPAVVTLDAAGKTTANKAACQCVEGTYPGIPDSYSCKANGQPGHYVNCIPGVPKR